MISSKLLSFSPTGEKLAHSGPDGILRIWNTISGILEHEYKPAEHLTATISCIQYSPQTKINMKKKKTVKKKMGKKKTLEADEEASLLALGTQAGILHLYCPEKREIVATLDHAAPHALLDVVWFSTERLFSLAANNTLVEWNIPSGEKLVSVDVKGGSTVCVLNGKTVCVAKREIEVLHIFRKSGDAKLKTTYTGHSSLVMQLLPLTVYDGPTRYFLSSSQDDRFIYVWDLSSENNEPAGSFMVKEVISTVAVSQFKEDTVTLAATTRTGTLVLFTQHLNGNSGRAAIKSVGKLRIVTEDNTQKTTIPIISSFFCNDDSSSIIIVYGQSFILKFEKMPISDISGDKELIRTSPSVSTTRSKTKLKKTITPIVTRDAVIRGPGHLTIQPESGLKRKHDDASGTASLPMEERLNALAIDKTTVGNAILPPKADNLAHLLLQGLHSKDQRILQGVLDRGDEETINNTVRRLPIPAVVPLLKQLQSVIMGKGQKNFGYVRWVRSILYHHMSHLTTLPNREELMQPFYAVSLSRMSTLHQVTQLHARLDLMLTHVTTRHQEIKQSSVEPEALLVYREESSDEDDMLETTFGVSESEDNWEEFSDIGEVNGHTDEDSDMEVDQQISSVKRRLDEEEEEVVHEVVSESEEEDGDSDIIVEESDSD